jgi:hypothetical protein
MPAAGVSVPAPAPVVSVAAPAHANAFNPFGGFLDHVHAKMSAKAKLMSSLFHMGSGMLGAQ